MWRRNQAAGLIIIWFLLGWAGAERVMAQAGVVVNTASQENILPAVGEAGELAQLAGWQGVTGGAGTGRVDNFEGRIYIDIRVPAMGTLKLQPRTEKLEPVFLHGDGMNFAVRWPGGATFQLGAAGFFMNGVSVLLPGEGIFHWKLRHQGNGLVQFIADCGLRIADSKKECVRLTLFAGGAARLEMNVKEEVGIPAGAQLKKLKEFMVVQNVGKSKILEDVLDSAWLGGRVLLVPEAGSSWRIEEGALRPEGAKAAAWLVPMKDAAEWEKTYAKASSPLIGVKKDGIWQFPGNGCRLWAFGEADMPRLNFGQWVWTDAAGKCLGVWKFNREPKITLKATRLNGEDIREFIHKKTEAGEEEHENFEFVGTLQPVYQKGGTLEIEDLSGRGIFLQGDLKRGGALVAARIGRTLILDLDDDGDADMSSSVSGHFSEAELEGGSIRLDIRDATPLQVLGAAVPGTLETVFAGGYTEQTAPYTWMFGKSLKPGLSYQGAYRGFEEQILYRIKSTDNELVRGPAALYLKTTNDQIDRMSMGCFGGSDQDIISYNIELDPMESRPEQPPSFRVCTFADRFGTEIKATSCVLPERWDGKILEFREQDGRGVDWNPFAAWQRVASGEMFDLSGVQATFAAEGTWFRAAEAMYTGASNAGFRIEVGMSKRIYPFSLYYSDLFGGLHLKGADYGQQGFWAGDDVHRMDNILENYYHREAVNMPGRAIAGRQNYQWEAVRHEGPMFLAYQDRDGDGRQDTYIYDAENDGIADRTLVYEPATKTVLLRQREQAAAWAYADQVEEVAYLPGNYNRVQELYLRGLTVQPLVMRVRLASGGTPIERTIADCGLRIADSKKESGVSSQESVEKSKFGRDAQAMEERRPEFFVVVGREWINRVGVDVGHGVPSQLGWEDFSDVGFSGLALRATAAWLTPVVLRERFTRESLDRLDLLVLPEPRQALDEAEWAALLGWVQAGGRLWIVPGGDEQPMRETLAGVAGVLGLALQAERVFVRSSLDYYWQDNDQFNSEVCGIKEMRIPNPDQDVKYFSSSEPNLLRDFRFLTCVGYPLEAGPLWRPLLGYKGRTMIAEAQLGRGRILISGMNIFANRYLNHVQFQEPKSQNSLLIERLIQRELAGLPMLRISSVRRDQAGGGFSIVGRGGPVKWPRRSGKIEVTANGKAIPVSQKGLFDAVELPAGKSEVVIK